IDNNKANNINYTHGAGDKAAKGAWLKVTTDPVAGEVCPMVSDSIQIILFEYPDIDALSPVTGCVPLTASFTGVEKKGIPANQLAWRWDFTSGDTSVDQNPANIVFANQGRYDVTLKVTNTAGPCATTITKTGFVEAYPNPVAAFTTDPNKTTIALPKFKMNNLSSVAQNPFNPQMYYLWNFGTGNPNDTSTQTNPRFAYGKDTATYTITLQVTTNHGCTNTTTRQVIVGPDIIVFIPDVFTPDGAGPGKNNTFNVTASNFKTYNIRIYNRWGEKMFETDDINKGWDGTANGHECQEGVYVYHVEVTSEEDKLFKFDGTITLLR
ncbi:MAG: gliding motility-associated C-terminal domain-containing protein, partial [Bacteroidetes bacterium]|nr:gliding motility-associated C-terminal domain-containing protein [Bacteroidota bacterium]